MRLPNEARERLESECATLAETLGVEVVWGSWDRVYLPLDPAFTAQVAARRDGRLVVLGSVFVDEAGARLGGVDRDVARARFEHGAPLDGTLCEREHVTGPTVPGAQPPPGAPIVPVPSGTAADVPFDALTLRQILFGYARRASWNDLRDLLVQIIDKLYARGDRPGLERVLRDAAALGPAAGDERAAWDGFLGEIDARLAELDRPRLEPASIVDRAPFSTLPRHEVMAALAASPPEEWRHAGGEPLMRKGDVDDAVYLILSGFVRVHLDDPRHSHAARVRFPGELLGEVRALQPGRARSAWVVPSPHALLWRLPAASVQAWLRHEPFRAALATIARRRLLDSWLCEPSPLWRRALTQAERTALADRIGEPQRFADGEVVVPWRSPAGGLWIVARGALAERRYRPCEDGFLVEEHRVGPGRIWGMHTGDSQRELRAAGATTLLRLDGIPDEVRPLLDTP